MPKPQQSESEHNPTQQRATSASHAPVQSNQSITHISNANNFANFSTRID